MLRQALNLILTKKDEKPKQNPYEATFNKNHFLAKYRVKHGVGEYASNRYFRDFETLEYFKTVEHGDFKIVYDNIKTNPYGIEFPQP